jgi:hypothetical protein
VTATMTTSARKGKKAAAAPAKKKANGKAKPTKVKAKGSTEPVEAKSKAKKSKPPVEVDPSGLPGAALADPDVPGLDLVTWRVGPVPVPERDPTPFEGGDDFVIEGYELTFGPDDELICTDVKKKKRLKNVPPKVRATEEYQALMRGRKDERSRARRARRVLEDRMISGVPFSGDEIGWLLADDAYAPLLKGVVVSAGADAGLLVANDEKRGLGVLPLDYDARWIGQAGIEVVHPTKLGDLTAWQDLLVDLGMQQPLVQAFRTIKSVPAAQRELTESSMLANRNTRSAAVAERVLMEDGWVCRRGMAKRKLSVRTDGGMQAAEAWFDYGEYYMPSDGTSTGSFGFNTADAGKPMKFSVVPPVLVSEAIYSLEKCLAQAGAKGDDDDEEGEGDGDGDDE